MRLLGNTILVQPIIREFTEEEKEQMKSTTKVGIEMINQEAEIQAEAVVIQVGEHVDEKLLINVGDRIIYEFNNQDLKFIYGKRLVILWEGEIRGIYTQEEKEAIEKTEAEIESKKNIEKEEELARVARDKRGGHSDMIISPN